MLAVESKTDFRCTFTLYLFQACSQGSLFGFLTIFYRKDQNFFEKLKPNFAGEVRPTEGGVYSATPIFVRFAL